MGDTKQFNKNFNRVTKKDYDSLTTKNKKRYDRAKDKGLIPAVKKGSTLGTIIVFDPTSFDRVADKELGIGMLRDEPSRTATTIRYNPDIGQSIPTSRPAMSRGPDSPRGRPASGSVEKNN